jgi:hypothetical protein
MQSLSQEKPYFSAEIPLRLVNENSYSGEHWSKRSKRAKGQKFIVKMLLGQNMFKIPCIVKLTRIAPRQFDDDNLRSCFKHVRDGITESIKPGLAPGRGDEGYDIRWQYAQEYRKKQFAMRIEINEI